MPLDQSDAFAQPFSYWVGMNTDPRTTAEALAEFNRFYSTTHVREVVAAHPGFLSASRYELVDNQSPGVAPIIPRWLAVYGMAGEAAAAQYLKDNERPWLHRRRYSPWPAARRRAKTVWRMIWRRTAAAGSLSNPSDLVVLVLGATAPTEALAPLPGCARATVFELYRGFQPPDSEAPRVCVVHEADTDQASANLGPVLYRRIPLPP